MEQFIGYHEYETLPVKRKDRILIPKGVAVRSTHPKRKTYVTARSQWITVNHILNGVTEGDHHTSNPKVCWAGTGGYWCEVDINHILPIKKP